MIDSFSLNRFIEAQAGVYDRALWELRAGRKRTHWMWFIFPQIAGLGRSATAQHFALSDLEEATAYIDHPLLGKRLIETTQAVNAIEDGSGQTIFGSPDNLKFRSSMTLFEKAAPDPAIFSTALRRFFDGKSDPVTLAILGRQKARH